MLGRIRWGSGRKVVLGTEQILGLSVLSVELPQNARKWEREMKKAAALLRKNRVVRVLVPPDVPWWPILGQEGLRPVETRALRYMLAPVWVAVQMKRRNILPETAVLRLKGEGSEPALERLARELCPMVRSLVFDIPGGAEAANRLRQEMGMPVLPGNFDQVDLTLRLDEGPVLAGAEITLSGRELPPDCDRVSLISALWENNRIKSEEIVLKL